VVKIFGLNPKDDLAPLITAAGVIGAVVIFGWKEASERRRKTMDAYEKLLYDKELQTAFSAVTIALGTGKYPLDSEDPRVGSIRDDTWRLINYLEVICSGVKHGLYDYHLVREFFEDLAESLIESFLVKPASGQMPSERFLKKASLDEYLPEMKHVFADYFMKAAKRRSEYVHRMPTDDSG